MTIAGDASHLRIEMRRILCGLTDSTQKQNNKNFSGLSRGKHLSLFQSLQVRLTFSSLISIIEGVGNIALPHHQFSNIEHSLLVLDFHAVLL